jgi:chromosome partitioning protein
MRSVALASQKGGVGKTTVALNVAFALARRGWRTLLVDGDPQGSIGLSLLGEAGGREGLVEFLEGSEPLARYAQPTRVPELHVLTAGRPSPTRSERWEASLANGGGSRLIAEAAPTYELLVADTASGLHGGTLALIRQLDHLLVPIQAEPLALRSIGQVLEAVGRLRADSDRLSIAGFIVTMLSSRQNVSLAVAQETWSMLPVDLVLEAFIPRDEAFLVASARGVPLGLLGKRPPPVATIFDQLAAELEPRLGLLTEEAEVEPIPLLD